MYIYTENVCFFLPFFGPQAGPLQELLEIGEATLESPEDLKADLDRLTLALQVGGEGLCGLAACVVMPPVQEGWKTEGEFFLLPHFSCAGCRGARVRGPDRSRGAEAESGGGGGGE